MRTRRSQSSSDPVPNQTRTISPSTGEVTHRSVLLHEALESLAIDTADTVVDATLGGAGHAKEITKQLGRGGLFIGFDLDSDAIHRAQSALAQVAPRVLLINDNFRTMKNALAEHGVDQIDKALFDLGWNSDQLDAGRGFSFQKDEPLLMTYRTGTLSPSVLTARDIVNEWAENSIADVLYGWGDERYSRRIAQAIVEERELRYIATTKQLVEIIEKAVPHAYTRGRLHPATRTFQALRIAVNDELGALTEGLLGAWQLLKKDGRIAVITFHSTEDRIVKQLFAKLAREEGGLRLTKKPLVPSADEIKANPRSRSAKLRVIQKQHDESFEKNKQISTERSARDSEF